MTGNEFSKVFEEGFQEGWGAGFGYGIILGCAATAFVALAIYWYLK